MGTFTSRIIIATLLVLLGVTMCSATRSLLFPYPYEGSHGGYRGGYGGGYGGPGGGYGGPSGGYGGYGGGPYGGPFFPGFGGGYGGGYGGIKDIHVGAGAGSGNVHEDKIGDFYVGGKHDIEKGNDYGVGNGASAEGAKKGPDGLAEGLGFGVRGHEVGEGIGYHEGGEKGSQFGGPGFGGGCGHKSEVVKPGITP